MTMERTTDAAPSVASRVSITGHQDVILILSQDGAMLEDNEDPTREWNVQKLMNALTNYRSCDAGTSESVTFAVQLDTADGRAPKRQKVTVDRRNADKFWELFFSEPGIRNLVLDYTRDSQRPYILAGDSSARMPMMLSAVNTKMMGAMRRNVSLRYHLDAKELPIRFELADEIRSMFVDVIDIFQFFPVPLFLGTNVLQCMDTVLLRGVRNETRPNAYDASFSGRTEVCPTQSPAPFRGRCH